MSLGISPFLDEEQRTFADTIRRFAREQLDDPDIGRRDAAGEFWDEGWRRCGSMGLCGLPAPEKYGGGGADRVTTAAALDALGYGCSDGGLLFSLQAHLWSSVVPLWHFGSDEQKEQYLPKLCSGEWIGLHAMTEPESGSDAFALSTVAEPVEDGWVLRGRKSLITNAPHAKLFIIFARTPESGGPSGVSGFLLEAGAPGLSLGPPTEKLGLRTSPMADVILDDVQVGRSAILGREGRGSTIFATSMMWERALIMASVLGAIERALSEAVQYARERKQFGQPIGTFEAVSDRLVNTRVALDAARALLFENARRYDAGERGDGYAAATKLFAAETAVKAALALLQTLGGYGFTRDFPHERTLRDVIGSRFYSGTSDMMRRIVARNMGL
ncbi:MAG TPA: acyl-CoA dehydrogenase family protein [Actinomycetota bacterium]|nr:acyl-CoA dehydrogenase family protein [Actinomycetota bacterium]